MGSSGKGGGGSTTIGYRYFMSIMMGVARGPIDQVVEIKVGDLGAYPNSGQPSILGDGEYFIDNPELFGGDKKEGGIQGNLTVAMGAPNQVIPSWWKSLIGGNVPDYRGVATMMFDGLICSLNPYPKKWKFRLRRTTSGWDGDPWRPEWATIWMGSGTIKAMNPAHILYECATNRQWGRGFPRSRINEDAWFAAAQTLYNEGFGLCLKWNRQSELQEFVQDVLDHIGGGIYADRETGLLTLHLIRDDYDANEIPTFTYETGLLSVERDDTAARDKAVNEVIVKYRSPIDDSEREIRAQNIASIQSLGSINSSTINYAGVPTYDLGARLAQRDLRIASSASRRYKIKLDRRAWRIFPGAVFAISAPDKGIARAIVRAGKISDGTLTDGTITVDAVIDVFGLPGTSYLAEPESNWTPPSTSPVPLVRWETREATYYDLVRRLSPAELAIVDVNSGTIATMGGKPNTLQLSYEIASRTGSDPFVKRGAGIFVPTARLSEELTHYQTTFAFEQAVEPGLIELGTIVQIGVEMVKLVSLTMNEDGVSGSMTVVRGCVDTVPTTHVANTLIFFTSDDIGTDGREYADGETVDVKLLSTTSTGTLSESLAPYDTVSVVARQGRPYPPANIMVNGAPAHGVSSVHGAMVVSWVHRDRLTQQDQILGHGDAGVGPEADVLYNILIYTAADTLLVAHTGIEGNSFVIPLSWTGALRFEIESVREGITSFQRHVFSLVRTV